MCVAELRAIACFTPDMALAKERSLARHAQVPVEGENCALTAHVIQHLCAVQLQQQPPLDQPALLNLAAIYQLALAQQRDARRGHIANVNVLQAACSALASFVEALNNLTEAAAAAVACAHTAASDRAVHTQCKSLSASAQHADEQDHVACCAASAQRLLAALADMTNTSDAVGSTECVLETEDSTVSGNVLTAQQHELVTTCKQRALEYTISVAAVHNLDQGSAMSVCLMVFSGACHAF